MDVSKTQPYPREKPKIESKFVEIKHGKPFRAKCDVKFKNNQLAAVIDSGATTTFISKPVYDQLTNHCNLPLQEARDINQATGIVKSLGQTILTILGPGNQYYK